MKENTQNVCYIHLSRFPKFLVRIRIAFLLTYVLKDSEDCELLGANEVMLSPSLS